MAYINTLINHFDEVFWPKVPYSKKVKRYCKEMINLKKENKLVSYSGLPIVNVVDPLNSYEKSE
jgi:hypothetical protein